MNGVHLSDAAAPDGMRIYAIGDVHGRLDLLSRLHDAIGEEIARDAPADWRIVHLGDYVDRGRDSRGVIDRLRRVMRTDSRFVALCGNHDIGMIDFLERADPEGLFPLYGGAETALSYGVQPDFSSAWLARRTADAMLEALPDGHLELIKGLGRSVAFGDYFFCHAGVRPEVRLADQDPDDLIWIRNVFLGWTGLHEKVVVHGHTPRREPELLPNRINVDTGAYVSGVLSAVALEGRSARILQVVTEV